MDEEDRLPKKGSWAGVAAASSPPTDVPNRLHPAASTGAALVLFAYFRISKKYRRNRNRVLSTVLGMIMATCGVLLVSGITVNYDEQNRDNAMIVVVDASYRLSLIHISLTNSFVAAVVPDRSFWEIV